MHFPDPPLHVALYEPEIPPNTGNISRLCAANEIPLHLIGKLGFSLDDKQLKRAGLDYWPFVDCRLHPDLTALRAALPGARCWYFTTKARFSFHDAPFRRGDCLVFGPESRGLPEPVLAEFNQQTVTIPMRSRRIRSLNLSTAVGVGLYEALRRVG